MNAHDSEHVAGVLQSAGYRPAESLPEAEVVIFNTCCVRQSAEDRVWGNLAAISSTDPRPRVLAVTGCMAERHGAGVMDSSPGVDLVFGMDALERLPRLIEECAGGRLCDLGSVEEARIDRLPSSRAAGARAWVPVSHGCDNNCSYCVVPSVRGGDRSRPASEIVDEVGMLAAKGVAEVVLLGQNVNSYGRDIDTSAGFAGLLEKVASVEGISRVKFETSHPRDLLPDVLEVMAGVPEVCEYLHLPVQSGSDRVLGAMNRGYGSGNYSELAARARGTVGGLTLTTDVIVGFPGETEEEFSETLGLLERVEFDAAYLFIYSPREGTEAASLPDDVSEEAKHDRFDRLATAQQEITSRSLERLVGTTQQVLIEGDARRGGLLRARTRGNRVVLLPAPAPVDVVADVIITGTGRHALRGRLADPESLSEGSER